MCQGVIEHQPSDQRHDHRPGEQLLSNETYFCENGMKKKKKNVDPTPLALASSLPHVGLLFAPLGLLGPPPGKKKTY
jgi:hypothetical protein